MIVVDGRERSVSERSLGSLAWWLRDSGHTAVKIGCEEGTCGSCVVLIDGEAVPACIVPVAALVDGARIETAHSLAGTPAGETVTAALADTEPLQCGFCGPGILASCVAHLREHGALPHSEAEIRELLSSHLCRCTGHIALVAALRGTGGSPC
jgi:aerobic-type carbon monoxide dehydrogenase small subunit (CoxS/CutS family)